MKKRASSRDENVFISVLRHSGVSLAIMLVAVLIGAITVNMTKDPLAITDAVSLAVLLVSAVISGAVIGRSGRKSAMLISLLSSLFLSLILLMVGLVLSKGEISGRVFLNYLIYIGASALASRIGKRGRTRRSR